VFGARHVLTVGPVGSENRHVTIHRTAGGGHLIVAGCWQGTIDELAARISDDGDHGWPGPDADTYRRDYESVIAMAQIRIREWGNQ